MRTWLSRFALLVAVLGACVARAEEAAPAQATPAEQLAAVDRLFFSSYERAVHEVLAGGPPAFLVVGDRLVLYRHGKRQEWALVSTRFNELKTIAHVTLGLFAILSPANGGTLGTEALAALRQYQSEIAVARTAISQVGLDAAQRERQDRILAASSELISRALTDGKMPEPTLTEFCRSMRPLVEVNVREAVVSYLDELNRGMGAGLSVLTQPERAAYLVIVTGVHQARIDNAAMQYFNRLLHDPASISQRLMYAENVSDEAGALHLLGIHLMARRVGMAYFDDPHYMNRDLFAPAAAAYVPTMQLPADGR